MTPGALGQNINAEAAPGSDAPADFFLGDTSPQKAPITGVLVKVFSLDGAAAVTQSVTDAAGRAGFLLPSGVTYQARFYKLGVAFRMPLLFAVMDGPNAFDVSGDVITPRVPTDPRLCTAHGFFRTVTGAPAPGVDVHFIAKFRPLLLDNAAVLTERAVLRTDQRGYGEITLIRGGQYDVTVQGFEDVTRTITIPDAPSVLLPNLLFPVVGAVVFSPQSPFLLAAKADVQLVTTVIATDGRVLAGAATEDVRWSSSNENVFVALVAGGVLTLRGIAPGVAELRAERLNQSIVRIPDLPIAGVPASVRVSS